MLQTRLITCAALGLGIRGSGRLSQDVFRAPLDAIEAALPEDLRKPAVNHWLGSLMIPLPPGCPEGSWRFARFGALSSSWRDLFGERARRSGGLGERQGAGP